MLESSFLNSQSPSGYSPYVTEPSLPRYGASLDLPDAYHGILSGFWRRLRRERRRRKVGRAYDMALEIARAIPNDAGHSDVVTLDGPPWMRTTIGYFLSASIFAGGTNQA